MKRIQAPVTTPLLAAVIFALNIYVCWGLFGIEYLRHMGSIEGSFIGLARYAGQHWGDLRWFPLWHLGMPYANVYPPLLSWEVAGFARLSGFSIAHAFHWVTAITYCLGPVAVFALTLRLTKSPRTAFAAGAIDSFVSWSAWLIPAVRIDLGSPLDPRRLQALVFYGEGPHVASMTVLPLALLCWDFAMKRRSPPAIALAAIATAATVLTSWLGGFALAMMIAAYALARLPALRDLWVMAAIAVSAYFLAMPFVTPSIIAATQLNSKTLGGDFTASYLTLPKWAVCVAIGLVGLKFAIRKLDSVVQFAIAFAFLLAAIVFPFAWFNISAVPQPIRYHLELEMALSLLAAIGGNALLRNRPRAATIALAALCVALIVPVKASRRYARNDLIRPIDIQSTTEWKTAQWVNREWSGERIMMPGSTGFWLTAFSDVPLLNGGPEQGVIDQMARVADYIIFFGPPRSGDVSALWLKALGVQAVGVSLPGSGEFYKPFVDPHQFDALLQPIIRTSTDVIFRVGAPHTSLARVVPAAALVSRTPKHGLDVDPLRAYVAALDDPSMPRAALRWNNLHSVHITADLGAGQVISVQQAWHPGWHADSGGTMLPVRRDQIGQMYLDPGRTGQIDIDLVFDGDTEMKFARAASIGCALILAAASLGSLFAAKKPGR